MIRDTISDIASRMEARIAANDPPPLGVIQSWAGTLRMANAATDDIEDVLGEPEADDADSQPIELPADANDGPVPLQAGEEA